MSAARHQPDLRQISVTVRRDRWSTPPTLTPSGVLTRRERIGWYAYDFATSPSTKPPGRCSPLLLDALATDRRGTAGETSPSACDDASDPSTAMVLRVRSWSRNADHHEPEPVRDGGGEHAKVTRWDGTTPCLATASASVLIQAVTFITLGSFGNYGTNRRRWMKLSRTSDGF